MVNVLFLSKLWYVLNVTPLPLNVYKRIKGMVLTFLWGDGRAMIAYNMLISMIDDGGLGLLDPYIRMKSLRVKLVKRLLNGENHSMWKEVMKFYLEKKGACGLGINILWRKTKNFMTSGIPCFYKEVLDAWGNFSRHIRVRPRGRMQMLEQPLFFNQNISYAGSPIYFKKWWDGGLRQVRDVLYEVKEGFLPVQAVVDAIEEAGYAVQREVIEEHYGWVKAAIPKEWIWEIEKGGTGNEKGMYPDVALLHDNSDTEDFLLAKTRAIYVRFRDQEFVKPVANKYWINRYGDMREEDLWDNVRLKYIEPTLENFTFLQRHNCLLTEMRLCKIGLTTDATCSVCGRADEGLMHLFLYCVELVDFLRGLKDIVGSLAGDGNQGGMSQAEWEKLILFGSGKVGRNKYVFHLVIAVARYSIWIRRNVVKHRKVMDDVRKIFEVKMKHTLCILYQYFMMKDEIDVLKSLIGKTCPFIQCTVGGFRWVGVL